MSTFHPAYAAMLLLMLAPHRAATADAIDEYVRGEMGRQHIPGLALTVVRGGEVVKAVGYGTADLENDVPVTEKTVFQIQSVTKTMTAAAILLLADEGKLSINDRLSKRLDGTPEAWADVTLRHLLTHTSGIKDFINEATASLRLEVTEEAVLHATAPRPLNFKPGEKYAYSNTGYHLLAMVIRKTTGKAYGDFLAERFFVPLGMSQTRVISLSEVIPHRAAGYAWDGKGFERGGFVAESVLAYGGGGVISTAADMATWAKALAAGKVLPKATMERAWTPATLNDESKSSYGLGWRIDDANGHRCVNHGGAHLTGFTSHLAHYPDDGLTVIVLTNAGNGNPSRIARRVARLADPALAPPVPKPIEDKEPAVTAKVAAALAGLAEGAPDEKLFTKDLWALISGERAAQRSAAESRGPLQPLQLIGRDESPNARTYRYRADSAAGPIRVMAVFGEGDLIGGWKIEDE